MTASPDSATESKAGKAADTRVASALLRYRVMAYVTGVMLVLLTIGVLGKLITGWHDEGFWTHATSYIGIAHGWLYMVYILVSLDMAIKVRWRPLTAVLILLAGTVPLMSFVAEHYVTQAVRAGKRL